MLGALDPRLTPAGAGRTAMVVSAWACPSADPRGRGEDNEIVDYIHSKTG
ncbi:hypothetical protein [Kitasatospora aureofaciens]